MVEYTLHVRPVAKMEVMGLRTELTVGGEPSPFGVAGYDAEENEFDTLDGLQISWYAIAFKVILINIGLKQVAWEKYLHIYPQAIYFEEQDFVVTSVAIDTKLHFKIRRGCSAYHLDFNVD